MNNRYQILGKIYQLNITAKRKIENIHHRVLLNCVERGGVYLCENESEIISGYITWALVNKFTARRILLGKESLKYPYEFDEGKIVYITDIFLPDSKVQIKPILKSLFKDKRVVLWNRKGSVSMCFLGRYLRKSK